MSKPPRIDRKTLKGPDEFQKKGVQILDFIAEQRARFAAALIAVAVAVVAVLGWDSFSARRKDKAWVAFNEANKAAEPQRWDKLKAMQGEWSGFRAGFFAAITLADHYFDEGKKELLKAPGAPSASAPLALQWYEKALQFSGVTPSEKQLLQINHGNTNELLGKFDEALADYQMAVSGEGDAKGYALLNLGRAYELKKDTAKAEETYTKISTDYPNTEYAKTAKNQLRRLKSPLFANSKL